MKKYDVVVVGAGHAGVEAAFAAARLKKKTLLTCIDLDAVALMPCNPAIGGTAKGHLVREIDALGGQMAICTDKSLLQIKMLNRTKGPAVFSLRGQADKKWYHDNMMQAIKEQSDLELLEAEVTKILTNGNNVTGVEIATGKQFETKAVIIATGTYLNGKCITGPEVKSIGPSGYAPANLLTNSLLELGLDIRRFKTGTPARIFKDSVDYDKMEIQEGEDIHPFSFMTEEKVENLLPCYLTYTNLETHKIIRDNIERSPLFNGTIKGVGPRYCPSIEDKVMRFQDKLRHHIFVEPEGLDNDEVYIQGLSSSLPKDVQEAMYHSCVGLENCKFSKYAYAIEYDCINPLELSPTLAVKNFNGLYSAGQFNGSSGYEEAAAQGLMAGVNACLFIDQKPPFILGRDEAYIGVLIDDLTTKGTNEPYRMMTARAEHRIFLRQDNADRRLTQKGRDLGLIDDDRYAKFEKKLQDIKSLKKLSKKSLPKSQTTELLKSLGETVPQNPLSLYDLMKRPIVSMEHIRQFVPMEYDDMVVEAVLVETKYEGYLKKQQSAIKEQKRVESKILPKDIDYNKISGLRIEARQKLEKIRPLNLGQASRISGVSPADIAVLIVYLQKLKMENNR